MPDARATGPPADAGQAAPSPLSRLWSVAGSVVAPASLVTATLFYFGYVSARAQFEYFGVDVDVLGFSTQEFVMRAPQPLLVPALVVLLLSGGLAWADGLLAGWLRTAPAGSVVRWARGLALLGGVLLAAALVLLLAYPALEDWSAYPTVTPVLLGAGAGTLARAGMLAPAAYRPRAGTLVVLVAVVVVSVFWVTATVAQWSGTGQAKALARDLTDLPAVVVDTADPLFPGDPTVAESVLPPPEGTTAEPGYRYRYRGLRLLVEGDGRLFLVPQTWSAAGSTFVVGLDDARVKFRFVDDAP